MKKRGEPQQNMDTVYIYMYTHNNLQYMVNSMLFFCICIICKTFMVSLSVFGTARTHERKNHLEHVRTSLQDDSDCSQSRNGNK